jgi:eukaryotic translation initiation factor 2C
MKDIAGCLFRYTPVGRSFFSPPDVQYNPLGGGREVWFGFHQSVRPSYWRMSLNIDGKDFVQLMVYNRQIENMVYFLVSATAFYKSQPVIDFMCEVLDIRDIQEQRRPLNDAQRVKFTKEIKGSNFLYINRKVIHSKKFHPEYHPCERRSGR